MTLKQFRDLLLTVSDDVFHHESTKENDYIVWHEVRYMSLKGDNGIAQKAVRIAVDYFSTEEYSDIPDRLTEVLAGNDEVFLKRHTVIYEEDTGYIHHSFSVEVILNGND